MIGRGRPLLVALHLGDPGDFADVAPALRRLARAFPDHHRVLAGPASLSALARKDGELDMIIDTPGLEPLHPGLHGADIAVNLHDASAASVETLASTNPRRLVSFGVDGAPRWDPDEEPSARWCRLLEESGLLEDELASADLGR